MMHFYATEYAQEGTSLFDRSKGDITVVTGTTATSAYVAGADKFVTVTLSGFSTTSEGKLVGTCWCSNGY